MSKKNIKYQYCITQFNKVVEFITTHNECFLGKTQHVSDSLKGIMNDLLYTDDNNCWYMGTMGFIVLKSLESLEGEPDEWYLEILVDPAVSSSDELEYFHSEGHSESKNSLLN